MSSSNTSTIPIGYSKTIPLVFAPSESTSAYLYFPFSIDCRQILEQGTEHGVTLAQMMTIDGDVLARCLIIRTFEGKQGAQFAFLPGKKMMEVILGIVGADNRVIDLCSGDGDPGNEIAVLFLTRYEIHTSLRLFCGLLRCCSRLG